MEGSAAGGLPGAGSSGGSGWGSGAGEEAEGDEDENMVYYFLEESTGYMEPALRCLSLLHTLVAFLCIIGYNCLKVGHDHTRPQAIPHPSAQREEKLPGGGSCPLCVCPARLCHSPQILPHCDERRPGAGWGGHSGNKRSPRALTQRTRLLHCRATADQGGRGHIQRVSRP